MEELAPISFSAIETSLPCFSSYDSKQILLQWNLDQRFSGGQFSSNLTSEYDRLLKDFFRSQENLAHLDISGTPILPVSIEMENLSTSVMNMDFFDRLEEIAPNGHIKGCFEEIYDGITVGDLVRDVLVNEDSENAYLFKEADKNQYIYHIFKLFSIGGSMCQPDNKLERYFNLTKGLYKDSLTVYRDSKTDQVAISGRVYKVKKVVGLDLFTHPENSHNTFFLIVCPMKKVVTVIKQNYKPWF